MTKKVPLFSEIFGRLPEVKFEGGNKEYNDFLMKRHNSNELKKFGVDLEHAEFDKEKFIAKLVEDKVQKNPKLHPDRLSAEMSKRYASLEAYINFVDNDRKVSLEDVDDRVLNEKIQNFFDGDYSDFEKKVSFKPEDR